MMVNENRNKLAQFEDCTGYQFRNYQYLLEALTHRSFLNESPGKGEKDNERLEFLGDAILSFCVSVILFKNFPEDREGILTKARASLVDERSLAEAAREIGIPNCLRMGKGEEKTGGRQKNSILADAYEALLGAIFLDGGIEPVERLVTRQFAHYLEDIVSRIETRDPKTRFQEIAQALLGKRPSYSLKSTQGPDHARKFLVAVLIDAETYGEGEGESKKEAEQKAATEGLRRLTAVGTGKLPE